MYVKALSGLVVLVITSIGIGFFVWQTSNDQKTYKNSVYGYTLSYPSKLDAKEYSDEDAVFGTKHKDDIDARVEVRVVTAQGEPGQTVHDAVAMQLDNFCAADGSESSFSCTGILSIEPYATEHGDAGFILMLKGELKDFASGSITAVPKGPYYVLTLASSATISNVLVISPPETLNPTEVDSNLIRAIAESVYLSNEP